MPETIFYANYDITLDEANPDTNWSINPYTVSGLYFSSSTPPSDYRALLYFDISSLPSDAIIQNCFLNIYVTSAANASTTDYFAPYLVNSPWTVYTKWNDQPGINYSVRGSREPITNIGPVRFDISQILNYWITSGVNNGLLLKGSETVEYATKTFVGSRNWGLPGLRPFLSINYNNPNPILIYERRSETLEQVLTTTPSYNTTNPMLVDFIFEYTIFVQNLGINSIDVILEVSPDGVNFTTDTEISIVNNQLIVLTPKYFTNYIRLRYKSTTGNSNLKFWLLKQI